MDDEELNRLTGEIERVLKGQEGGRMEYNRLKNTFSEYSTIDFHMGLVRLKRDRRIKRESENGKVFYRATDDI